MEGAKNDVFTVKFLYFSISFEISLQLPAKEAWDSEGPLRVCLVA